MAVQTAAGVPDTPAADAEVLPGFAVAAIREDGRWRCTELDSDALVDLDSAISELRAVRSPGAVLGLLAVDDCFFVLLRPVPGGVSLMLSDALAALDYDVAADVLDLLRVDLPPDDAAEDDPWPEGDMSIVADLGLPADELEVLAGELELYPDEQLSAIGRRCGFDEALTALLQASDGSAVGG
ncbi:MAG: tRNA adenosine deaminase-associated protein [Actinomycetota bacterium]|nr:tRNA adenosine deaminase-associated protein [Actinomycetota bacterium]